MRYRYELVHCDDADFIAYQRHLGENRWQTVATWMIPDADFRAWHNGRRH